jgi:hypothetical protein
MKGPAVAVSGLGCDIEPISKLHTLDDLWHLIVAIEPTLRRLGGCCGRSLGEHSGQVVAGTA